MAASIAALQGVRGPPARVLSRSPIRLSRLTPPALRRQQLQRQPCAAFKAGDGAETDGSALLERLAELAPQAGPQASVQWLQQLTAVPQMWEVLASRHGSQLAMTDQHHHPPAQHSFEEAAALIRRFAAGLHSLGIAKGDRVSLFSEGGARWMIADQGIQLCGAVGAVRGVLSIPTEELQYIMTTSESRAVVVQDAATLDRLLPVLASPDAAAVEAVVVLWGEPSAAAQQQLPALCLLSFDQLMARGERHAPRFHPPSMKRDSLATLAFTSGTGGKPKGVMLTHGNLLSQLEALEFLGARPGQRTVAYLPPWHMFGRCLEYYLYSRGVSTTYTNLRRLKEDLQATQPQVFITVPLMLDALQSKAMAAVLAGPQGQLAKALFGASKQYLKAVRVVRGVDLRFACQAPTEAELAGARMAAAALAPVHRAARHFVYKHVRRQLGFPEGAWVITGGGSLAGHLDDWYEILGVQVLQGYGLTETSPVLTVRRKGFRHNVRGAIGPALPHTQLRIADPETHRDVPDGQQGLIMAKGPQVMSGYYKNEQATKKAFPVGDGWFDTGDLGWRVPEGSNMAGNIVITGRAKDTIVLSNGENIEPQPLEDKVQESPYIQFCVLLGSGHRALGALIVPDAQAVQERAGDTDAGPLTDEDIRALIHSEIVRALAGRPAWEHIHAFEVLKEPFSVESGTLTRTLKPRRPLIVER